MQKDEVLRLLSPFWTEDKTQESWFTSMLWPIHYFVFKRLMDILGVSLILPREIP